MKGVMGTRSQLSEQRQKGRKSVNELVIPRSDGSDAKADALCQVGADRIM
jgi:hypothetical protein